jgi:hypothetical protein
VLLYQKKVEEGSTTLRWAQIGQWQGQWRCTSVSCGRAGCYGGAAIVMGGRGGCKVERCVVVARLVVARQRGCAKQDNNVVGARGRWSGTWLVWANREVGRRI